MVSLPRDGPGLVHVPVGHTRVFSANTSAHIFRAREGCPARRAPVGAVVCGTGQAVWPGLVGSGRGWEGGPERVWVSDEPLARAPLGAVRRHTHQRDQVTPAACGSRCASLSSVHTLHRGDRGPTPGRTRLRAGGTAVCPNFFMEKTQGNKNGACVLGGPGRGICLPRLS